VALKAVLLAGLADRLDALRELARARGLEVRLDPGVHRTLERDERPTRQRLDAAAAVAEELATPERRARLRAYDQAWQAQPEVGKAAPCAAGFHAFHLDAAGQLMACMLHRLPALDAARLGFATAWQELGEHGRLTFAPDSPCAACALGHLCGYCPAVQGLGEEPEYHCEVAGVRKRVLESDPAGTE
jgi:radical SAM protein with 4Fe4S-binding SPASM domain